MCYNVRVGLTKAQMQEAFNLTNANTWDGPRDRITIGQDLPAIMPSVSGKSLEMLFWGFTPAWMKDPKGGPKPGNARAETVADGNMFRSAFKHRRCLVPVTGFYEWIGETGNKLLLPFTMPGRPVFTMPAIWEDWTMPSGDVRRSCATITADPNGDLRPYHDRMPVILDADDEDRWLSPDSSRDELLSLLVPLSDGSLEAHHDQAFKPARATKGE